MIIIPSRRRQRCRTNTNRNSNRRSTVLPTTYIALLSFVIATRYSIEGYCPVVICPGFCNDSHDYETDYHQPSLDGTSLDGSSANSLSGINPLSDNDHSSLKSVLAKRGFTKSQIYTIPVQRHDWIRSIAGGLLFDTRNFQQCTTQPDGVAYGWYIKRLKEMVDVAYKESGGQKVLLIGHSAGGWLARAAMGDGIWSEECEDEDLLSLEDSERSNKSKVIIRTSDRIRCLATIGSIHQAPEQDTTTCVTRGALKYTNDHYPGAFLKKDGIGYVSIGGISTTSSTTTTTSVEENKNDNQRVAYTSYKAVSGNEKYTLGDGVVPIEWTQLLGSKQIQLNNVLHSKHNYRAAVVPAVSATTTAAVVTTSATQQQRQQQQQSWYGSENVIDQWLSFVLEEANLLQRVVKVKNVSSKTKRQQQVATTSTFFDNLLVKTRVAAVAVLGEKQIVQVEQEQQAVVTTFDKSVIVDDGRKSSLSSLSSQQQQQYRLQQQRRQQHRQRRPTKYYHVRSFNVLLRRRMLQVFLLFLKIMNIPQHKPSSLSNFNKNSDSNDSKKEGI